MDFFIPYEVVLDLGNGILNLEDQKLNLFHTRKSPLPCDVALPVRGVRNVSAHVEGEIRRISQGHEALVQDIGNSTLGMTVTSDIKNKRENRLYFSEIETEKNSEIPYYGINCIKLQETCTNCIHVCDPTHVAGCLPSYKDKPPWYLPS